MCVYLYVTSEEHESAAAFTLSQWWRKKRKESREELGTVRRVYSKGHRENWMKTEIPTVSVLLYFVIAGYMKV